MKRQRTAAETTVNVRDTCKVPDVWIDARRVLNGMNKSIEMLTSIINFKMGKYFTNRP